MKATDIQEGQYFCRPFWQNRGLLITKRNGKIYYFQYREPIIPFSIIDLENGILNNELRKLSSAYEHKDFYLISAIQNTQNKETKMKNFSYTKAEIVVVDVNGLTESFETEEGAYEYIQDKLEANPKLRFKMFKAYQAVEPQRVDIASMIKKL